MIDDDDDDDKTSFYPFNLVAFKVTLRTTDDEA